MVKCLLKYPTVILIHEDNMADKIDEINEKYIQLLKKKTTSYILRKKALGHYTDITSLMNIIENDEIWFSRREYINDVEEIDYVSSVLEEVFSEMNTSDPLRKTISDYLQASKQYVFSLSTEIDVVNQWMAYSLNDGYCICFDRKSLLNYYNNRKYFSVKGGKVIYNKEEAKEIFRILVQYFEEIINNSTTFLTNIINQQNVIDIFFFYFSLIKKENYKYENEYRIVIIDNNQAEFRKRNGIVLPYIKTSNKPQKLPINKIIIGPKTKDNKAKTGLEEFLAQKGYQNTDVEFSQIHLG
jgi:hypothetical protein